MAGTPKRLRMSRRGGTGGAGSGCIHVEYRLRPGSPRRPAGSRAERYRSGHNGAHSKCDGGITAPRGFESHPLRQLVFSRQLTLSRNARNSLESPGVLSSRRFLSFYRAPPCCWCFSWYRAWPLPEIPSCSPTRRFALRRPESGHAGSRTEDGLYLQIEPSGGRYWRFNYRFNGKQKTLALGVYPDVSLAKARRRLREEKGTRFLRQFSRSG